MFRKLYDYWRTPNAVKAMRARFDPAFYREHDTDLNALSDDELLKHYCTNGWQHRYDPAPDFSTRHYLEAYPDVAAAKINPFAHYLMHGQKEGRTIMSRVTLEATYDLLRTEFDPDYYRLVHPYVASLSDQLLLEHFHQTGWRAGGDPNAAFSVNSYLEDHADVARAEIDPFYHYLSVGRAEGRQISTPLPRLWEHLSDTQIIQLEAKFDAAYYGEAVKDPNATPRALLAHYVDTGWHQGFDKDLWRHPWGLPPDPFRVARPQTG